MANDALRCSTGDTVAPPSPPRKNRLSCGTRGTHIHLGLGLSRRKEASAAQSSAVPSLTTAPRPSIVVDSREQTPLVFTKLPARVGTLTTGDYSVAGCEEVFAVERKTVADLVSCCMSGNRERFEREMHRLRGYRFKRLMIIGHRIEIEQHRYRSNILPQSILGSLGAWEIRYDLPVVWADTPEAGAVLVERWAHYFAREVLKQAAAVSKAVDGATPPEDATPRQPETPAPSSTTSPPPPPAAGPPVCRSAPDPADAPPRAPDAPPRAPDAPEGRSVAIMPAPTCNWPPVRAQALAAFARTGDRRFERVVASFAASRRPGANVVSDERRAPAGDNDEAVDGGAANANDVEGVEAFDRDSQHMENPRYEEDIKKN